mgnify:CR=1 FL=1
MNNSKSIFKGNCFSDRLFFIVDTIILFLVFVIVLYPLLYVLSSSFSGGTMLLGLSLVPENITLDGYLAVFEEESVWSGYANSILYTVIGTVIAMLVTILCAYPLSRSDFKPGIFFMGLCVFTMYFSGGLIPTYLWIRNLGLINTMWAILLPASLSIYNMIVMRTYFKTSIPSELREAAQLDGCGEWRYLVQIVLPLSGSVLGVVALYYGVVRWNGYFDSMIYLQDRNKLPLQNILREILIVNSAMMEIGADAEAEAMAAKRAELLKYSVIVLASLPMMMIYPFVQKSFVKGVMLGSIKG